MENKENYTEEVQHGIPLDVPTYEDNGGVKKGLWIAFFILAFITLMLIIFVLGEDDQPKQEAKNIEAPKTTYTEVKKERCKDEFGIPKERYCKKALKNEGLDVDKIKKWGGSDNGANSAICSFSYLGEIYAFEVVFDGDCNAISVKRF